MPARSLRIQFTAIRTNARFKPTAQQEHEIDVYAANFAAKLITVVQKYPAPPEGSGYVRTYTLLNSWDLKRQNQAGAIRYLITNNARDNTVGYLTSGGETRTYSRGRGRYYARWVHGPTQEGAKRDQGWKNLGDELEKMGGRGKFAAGVQKILDRGTSEFRTSGRRGV